MEEEREGTEVSGVLGGWWGKCRPHVRLMRAALLSCTPEDAVVAPLHGCFAIYMTHLQNRLLPLEFARRIACGDSVSPLEAAFTWFGGWRPTTALTLVYSLMGIEIKDALKSILDNVDGKSLLNAPAPIVRAWILSTEQLSVMHVLQKRTQNAENNLSKKLATLQMLVTDQDVLEAVMAASSSSSPPVSQTKFTNLIEKRMSQLRRLCMHAEKLRLHTLHDLLSLLSPVQAARAGIAAFELYFALQSVGSPRHPIVPCQIQRPDTKLIDNGVVKHLKFDDTSWESEEVECDESKRNALVLKPSQSIVSVTCECPTVHPHQVIQIFQTPSVVGDGQCDPVECGEACASLLSSSSSS